MILTDPCSTSRDRLAAARLLSSLCRVDQLDDRLEIERSKQAKPEAIEARDAWTELHEEIEKHNNL